MAALVGAQADSCVPGSPLSCDMNGTSVVYSLAAAPLENTTNAIPARIDNPDCLVGVFI
jgi:hypothetical protein